MDFEDAKENIQPLAAGRNASILHASLHVESPQELLAQRRELEQAIHNYKGDDPLEPWYAYISWIEQSFPSGGKESGLEEVLTKCLSRFENEERYFQDRRMVKLYMKFIDSHPQPMQCYQQLFNSGIGTMVADFYICWAYHYDLCGNTRKADEIFRRGIACRAQPLEELQEAHQHFGFTVAQRVMYEDDDSVKESTQRQFAERRQALTSLRGHRRKATVGSIRTGAVVKSYTPGTVQTAGNPVQQLGGNIRVPVFNDENATRKVTTPTDTKQEIVVHDDNKSVVRSIIDAARDQENLKEPGPWNKAHDKKKAGKLFNKTPRNTDLAFNIHEDIDMDCDDDDTDTKDFKKTLEQQRNIEGVKAFKYPPNFKHRNLPQKEWITPVTIENEPEPRTFPQYNKCFMYPRANLEFQPEEYRAYCWLRKRGICNEFTAKRDCYWRSNDMNVNVRQYPNFAKQSRPQKLTEVDAYYEPERKAGLKVCLSKLYDTKAKVEYQWEELMAQYLRRHDTILMDADMDETTCGMISERVQRRKSFFPSRRSMMPRRTMTSAIKESNFVDVAKGGSPNNNQVCDDSVVFVKEIPKECAVPCINPTSLPVKFEIFEDTTQNLPLITAATTAVPKPTVAYQQQVGASRADLDYKMKASDTDAKPTKPALPFEIFEDTTHNIPAIRVTPAVGNIKLTCQDGETDALATDVDFKFKTPALPNTAPLSQLGAKSTTTNTFGFEIYTEETAVEEPPQIMGAAAACEGAVGGGALFDPDETCSTQTFNIFIKSQSVSTPKMAQKSAPPRQFGSILKSIPQPAEVIRSPSPQPSPNAAQSNNEEQENCMKTPSEYSPVMPKQLSTILETSEHATTQGTHTTGNTKSSNSTSDGEGERELVTRLVFPHTALEPLEEQSRESSTMPAEVIVSLESISIQGNTSTTTQSTTMTAANKNETVENQPISKTNTAPATELPPIITPLQTRLQFGLYAPTTTITMPLTTPTTASNFSILTDENTGALSKQIGNFTRLDEREDTAAGLAIRSVRFQEDKTETISKVLLHSRSLAKFQEDKTETLPTIPIAAVAQYEMDQTNTMPKLPKEPSILFTAPNATNLDDSFEFFGQTPPGKSLLHPRYEVSAFKECMESRTPLSSAKRHCNVNTPDMMLLKAPRSTHKQDTIATTKSASMNLKGPALFEDEVDKITSKTQNLLFSQPRPNDIQRSIAHSVPIVHKVISRDSYVPDFSLIEETQPKPQQISKANDSKTEKAITPIQTQAQHDLIKRNEVERNDEIQEQRAKSNLGDSYFKDFSEIMESQPTNADSKWHRSATKMQLMGEMPNTPKGNNVCNSFLKDFSAIMESQPTEKDKAWLQNKGAINKSASAARKQEGEDFEQKNAVEKPKVDLGSSYLKDFSMVMDSQPLQAERDWRQSKQNKPQEVEQQQQTAHAQIAEETKKADNSKFLFKDASLVTPTQAAVIESKFDLIKSQSTTTTPKISTFSTSNKSDMSQPKLHLNNKSDLGSSYLKDFSFVPESQPIENANSWLTNKSSTNKINPLMPINEPHLKEFSLDVEAQLAPPPAKPSENTTKQPIEQQLMLDPATTTPAKPLLFLNSFMNDFAGFDPTSTTKKTTSRLTFLNDSKKSSDSMHSVAPLNISEFKELKSIVNTSQNTSKLLFLDNSKRSKPTAQLPPATAPFSNNEKSFELNAETAQFATNISMIKNSTLLPMNDMQNILQPPTPIKEQSLHIKSEYDTQTNAENNSMLQQNQFKTPPLPVSKLPPVVPGAPCFLMQSHALQGNISKGAVPKTQTPTNRASSTHESKIPQLLGSNIKQQQQTNKPLAKMELEQPAITVDEVVLADNDDDDDPEMSIYFKHTPKTPKIQQHVWHESSPSPKTPSRNVYVHREVDLNVTNQIIDNVNVDTQVNPFNGYLQTAFLEQIVFSNYIEELPNCMMVGHVSRLHAATKVKVNDIEFDVRKLVGEGAYGAVFCGINSKTGKKCALKQERPPNFWEYYICLEVHSRLNSDDLVCAFMSIDYALIGNNASILISPFSVHGSLITVCNKIKKHTLKNVDEYVVMLLTLELLSIIDHLHAINIIHADIKADNFLLMNKLEYPSTQYALQLIDFGVSIDMKLFKEGQTFNYVHNENAFKCVEMREGRPWTYQLDLYGLAGVIHVLLFGKFMDIAQRLNGIWMHKTHTPRYINRTLWDTIFQTLLNVRDCETMPNLQNLRALIKEEIADKEKFVIRKVAEFNSALISD